MMKPLVTIHGPQLWKLCSSIMLLASSPFSYYYVYEVPQQHYEPQDYAIRSSSGDLQIGV